MSPEAVVAAKKPGRIYTFYSYKGGTGRTMALANVAWIMASAGKRVLTIDWDLEAPGLHRYYHPFLSDPEVAQGEGLIDFLLEFVGAAHQETEAADSKWFEPYANILPFAVPIAWEFADGGALHMVPAGRQDGGYATRVTSFDWASFYTKLGGGVFLEAVKRRLRDEYDYVLIDSRTGLSDTSGICSVQMPDDLVCCFTLNTQSINGAAGVADSAYSQRLKPSGEPGLRVWPVSTRVEMSEREKLDNAREMARLKFSKFIAHLPRKQRASYMPSVEVLYQPYFAYEEILATIADRRHQTGSLLGSFENITRWITNSDVAELASGRASEQESSRIVALEKFTRASSAKPKIYCAVSLDKAQIGWLHKIYASVPGWYMRSAKDLSDWATPREWDRLKDARQFLTIVDRHFGEGSILMRTDLAPIISRLTDVAITPGTQVEADVVLMSVDDKLQEIPEVQWAIDHKRLVLRVQFPSSEVDFDVPLPAYSPRTWFSFQENDFEGSFLDLREAIEDAAQKTKKTRAVVNPEDPQKGRWGGSPTRLGRTLSADVSMISDDWFGLVLRVSGQTLDGEVTFYLHPTFQPNTLTVKAVQGVAEAGLQAYGAFTVGAVADGGATLLELDLSENPSFPQAFRER